MNGFFENLILLHWMFLLRPRTSRGGAVFLIPTCGSTPRQPPERTEKRRVIMQDTSETRPLRQRVGLRVWPFDSRGVPIDPATTLTIMSEVEDAGVPHIWLPYGPIWNPDLFIVLAAATTRTTRLTLGTSIIPISSRHPVLLAGSLLAHHRPAGSP
jgi:hypothetical protein